MRIFLQALEDIGGICGRQVDNYFIGRLIAVKINIVQTPLAAVDDNDQTLSYLPDLYRGRVEILSADRRAEAECGNCADYY